MANMLYQELRELIISEINYAPNMSTARSEKSRLQRLMCARACSLATSESARGALFERITHVAPLTSQAQGHVCYTAAKGGRTASSAALLAEEQLAIVLAQLDL